MIASHGRSASRSLFRIPVGTHLLAVKLHKPWRRQPNEMFVNTFGLLARLHLQSPINAERPLTGFLVYCLSVSARDWLRMISGPWALILNWYVNSCFLGCPRADVLKDERMLSVALRRRYKMLYLSGMYH